MVSAQSTNSINSILSPEYTLQCDNGSVKINRIELDLSLSPLGLHGKIAYILQNVFSTKECNDLIQRTEELGYSPVLTNYGANKGKPVSHRDCYRILIDDTAFMEVMTQRIGVLLPTRFKQHSLIGINDRFRFMRYVPGDKFKPHYDVPYTRYDATTYVTLQTYLNTVPAEAGGATCFLTPKNGRNNSREPQSRIPVQPKAGSVLVFEHKLLHEGSLLKDGSKYTVRTDVLYKLRPDETDGSGKNVAARNTR